MLVKLFINELATGLCTDDVMHDAWMQDEAPTATWTAAAGIVPPPIAALPGPDAAGTSAAPTGPSGEQPPAPGDAPHPMQPAVEPVAAPDAQQQVLDAIINHGAGQMPLFAGIVSTLQGVPLVGALSDNAMQLLKDLLALMDIVNTLTEACTHHITYLVACLADKISHAAAYSIDIAEWERRLQSPAGMEGLISFSVHTMLKDHHFVSYVVACMCERLSDPELKSDLIKTCSSIDATLHAMPGNLAGPNDQAILEAFQGMLDADMHGAMQQGLLG